MFIIWISLYQINTKGQEMVGSYFCITTVYYNKSPRKKTPVVNLQCFQLKLCTEVETQRTSVDTANGILWRRIAIRNIEIHYFHITWHKQCEKKIAKIKVQSRKFWEGVFRAHDAMCKFWKRLKRKNDFISLWTLSPARVGPLTGVSIWMLSAKFPMKAMMVIFCMSLSILLNCIMNRSSSDKFSRGFLSRS